MPRGGTSGEVMDNTRATAHADYDNDGDIDVVVVNNGGRARLLKNVAGDRGNAVRFRVLDEAGREAIGARVRIGSEADQQWREATAIARPTTQRCTSASGRGKRPSTSP